MRWLAGVTTALALMFGAAQARAETHALVMGFEDYVFKQKLTGSRNDAVLLAKVLKARGVTDITLVDEKNGSRSEVEADWAAMVARAHPGDLLFVSFSGHGNRSPEVGEPKHTPDGFEKGFLLPLYDETQHPEEQLRDEHLYDLFKAASDQGLKIMFVTDACHSGASVRAITAGHAPQPKFQRFETHGAQLPPPPNPASVVHRPPIPGLAIYSAADENQTIQEFLLDDEMHGALSYVVAEGIAGKAAGANNAVTEGALGRYVLANVRILSDNTQIPRAVTPDTDLVLFGSGAGTGAAAGARQSTAATDQGAGTAPPQPQVVPAPGVPPLGTTTLFSAAHLPPGLQGVAPSTDPTRLSIGWAAGGEVTNAHGDVIATGIAPERLQDAVDAQRVLERLEQLMGGRDRAIATSVAAIGKPASDRYYLKGEQVGIGAAASELRFLTAVDLSADGTIFFLYPRGRDPLEVAGDKPAAFPVDVSPPYGQDTLIFIESDQPLNDLHATLKGLDRKHGAVPFYEALRLWLPQVHFKLGLQSVFTCEALKEDGSCAASPPP